MNKLIEIGLPANSGFEALEQTVQEARKRKEQELALDGDYPELDMLHCVLPPNTCPLWKRPYGKYPRKLSKNERNIEAAKKAKS